MISPLFLNTSQEALAYSALSSLGLEASRLDSGCHRMSYTAHRSLPLVGAGDHFLSSCEVWTQFSNQATRLVPQSLSLFGEIPPWTYPFLNSSQNFQNFITSLDAKISQLRTQAGSASDAPLRVAQGLYNWLTQEYGISPMNRIEEQGLVSSVENRSANCSEFFSIFKMAFGRAGLEVNPAFVFESVDGDKNSHVATQFSFNGQSYLMDPLYHSFSVQHRSWQPITLREFWAWQLNNRGELSASHQRWNEMRNFFQGAERLDAYNPHIPNNLGLHLEESGDFAAAEAAYRRSIQKDSNFVEPYLNLSALLIERGRLRESMIWVQRGLQIQAHDARLFYNLALAQLRLGQYSPANRSIASAISNVSSIPSEYLSLQRDLQVRIPQNNPSRRKN